MKKIIIGILFLLLHLALSSKSQSNVTNYWIDTTLDYAKIVVNTTGFYEVSVDEIAKTYPQILGASPKNLNLFYRGKSINFELFSTGNELRGNDKIRFYGIRNNGDLESELYEPVTSQPHKFTSLYTNESAYFLTVDNRNPKNNRVSNEAETIDATNSNKIWTQLFENLKVFESEFSYNYGTFGLFPTPIINHSYFESGEGLTGKRLRKDSTYKFSINVIDQINTRGTIELLLNGRSNDFRKIRIKVANKDTVVNLSQFEHKNIKIPIVSSANVLDLELSSKEDLYSLTVLKYSYTRRFNNSFPNENIFINSAGIGTLQITETDGSFVPTIYNVNDPFEVKIAKYKNSEGGLYNYIINPKVPGINSRYYLFQNSLKPVSISLFSPRNSKVNVDSDYLIISNYKLKSSSEEYKKFRESELGGSYKVNLLYVEDLYNSFNYGLKTPLAIRNFMSYILPKGVAKNLLLFGKAYSSPNPIGGINGPEDLVPSIGYPASDLLLTSGIVSKKFVHGIPTGRIPVLTNEEGFVYLEKIKQNISLNKDVSKKNVLHFNGGLTTYEVSHFKFVMDSLLRHLKSSDFDIKYTTKVKSTPQGTILGDFSEIFNNGISLASFYGHSSVYTLDYNTGAVSDPTLGYNNKRFPVLFYNGCSFNNYFREIKTLSYDWLLTPKKGAIATIGQSFSGYEAPMVKFGERFYEAIFKSNVEPTIGEALLISAEKVFNGNSISYLDVLNNCQTLIFGDPAIKIFGYDKPELSVDSNSVVSSVSGSNRVVSFNLINTGKKIDRDKVNIKITQEGLPETVSKIVTVNVPKPSTKVDVSIPSLAVTDKIKIEIDNDNFVNESNETDNLYEIFAGKAPNPKDAVGPFVTAFLDSKAPSDGMIVSFNPTLELYIKDNGRINRKNQTYSKIIAFSKKDENASYEKIDFNQFKKTISIKDSASVNYTVNLGNYSPGEYFFLLYAADSLDNIDYSNPIKLNFKVLATTGSEEIVSVVYPIPSDDCVTFRISELSSFAKGKVTIRIYTFNGAFIRQIVKPLQAGYSEFSHCFGAKGHYMYTITTEGDDVGKKEFSGKLVISGK
ncbi:MAG: C25 family cysteine peptidase [Leadbetterella sp.]